MTEKEEKNGDLAEVDTPSGYRFKLSGQNVLLVIVTVVVCVDLAISWRHHEESRDTARHIVAAIGGFTSSQRQMACLLALPQDSRWKEFADPQGLCNRLARMGRSGYRLDEHEPP